MYIIYKSLKYPCGFRQNRHAVYYTNLPDTFPAPIDGEVKLHADDGFYMRTDNVANFLRQTWENNTLTLTNQPEPEPVPVEPSEPGEHEPTADEVLNALLGVTANE